MTNPENYEPDFEKTVGNKIVKKKGKTKQGKRQWIKTRNYRRIQARKAELERRKSSYAQSQNRRLVNEILRHGNIVKTENVSVKGWQKRYAKAISAKSPGFFQSELKRKVEQTGGKFRTVFYQENSSFSNSSGWYSHQKKPISESSRRCHGIQNAQRFVYRFSC